MNPIDNTTCNMMINSDFKMFGIFEMYCFFLPFPFPPILRPNYLNKNDLIG